MHSVKKRTRGPRRFRAANEFSIFVIFIALIVLMPYVHHDATSTSNFTKTPIKHLVVLMMENHSFDNLFGVYPLTEAGKAANGVSIPYNLLNHPSSPGLAMVPNGTFSTPDPYEGYMQYHEDWNNGRMNGFENGSGQSSLYYFGVNQTALEWDIAMNYALADNYFSSTLSETLPNRLYSIAGFSPVSQDQLYPPPFVTYGETILGEMSYYNVSWSYYFLNPVLGIDPLDFVYGINSHLQHIGTWGNFISEVSNGTLPDVSWVSPISGGAFFYSQHPPDNILSGEIWMYYIINAIMNSPLWNTTAIMITYDEGGGYYEQVAPPQIAGQQLGFRVPFIIVSPYAKEDYVSNTLLTHTSILAFIDYNWNMPPLNRLVAESNIPLDMFDFTIKYKNGQIVRPPYDFGGLLEKFIPDKLSESVSKASAFSSIGSIFPAPFQFNPSTLPYGASGNSSFNLSGSQINFVNQEQVYVPWFLNRWFYYPLSVVAVSGSAYAAYRIYRRHKRPKP
ncbi:MAG: alkaline phosphatase family protein [Thermoplasmataceae archaeon]